MCIREIKLIIKLRKYSGFSMLKIYSFNHCSEFPFCRICPRMASSEPSKTERPLTISALVPAHPDFQPVQKSA